MQLDKEFPGIHDVGHSKKNMLTLGKLVATYNFHLFCTTWSLLRTILDPASWWLSQSCDSYAAAFCCRDVGPNAPNNKHSRKNTCGTLPAQLQQWHPCEWQDEDGSQAKQNYHCMMAGIELENYASGHEMSNQQSEKQSFPNTNLDRLGKAGRYLQLRSFTLSSVFGCTGPYTLGLCLRKCLGMHTRNGKAAYAGVFLD